MRIQVECVQTCGALEIGFNFIDIISTRAPAYVRAGGRAAWPGATGQRKLTAFKLQLYIYSGI